MALQCVLYRMLTVKIMFLFYPSRLHFISKRWNIACYGETCVLFAFTFWRAYLFVVFLEILCLLQYFLKYLIIRYRWIAIFSQD